MNTEEERRKAALQVALGLVTILIIATAAIFGVVGLRAHTDSIRWLSLISMSVLLFGAYYLQRPQLRTAPPLHSDDRAMRVFYAYRKWATRIAWTIAVAWAGYMTFALVTGRVPLARRRAHIPTASTNQPSK
jgi:hypothetical protein